MNLRFDHVMGEVRTDADGNLWYFPDNGQPPTKIEDTDSFCGAGFFETGVDDPFRLCCSWHDFAYSNRALFESQGWNRNDIDKYFHSLCLERAGTDSLLIERANAYYALVRSLGWIWYYRHPGFTGNVHLGRPVMFFPKPLVQ